MGALLSVKGPWPISADPAEAERLVAEAWKRGVILATASALPNVIKIKPPRARSRPSWACWRTAEGGLSLEGQASIPETKIGGQARALSSDSGNQTQGLTPKFGEGEA